MTCFNCNVALDSWSAGNDPFKHHLAVATNCSFANKTYMRSLEERLGSFHTWPSEIKPLPIYLAAAGFFHSNKQTDAVTCFTCALKIDDWKAGDDPLLKHLQHSAELGKHCDWLDKIAGTPERIVPPVTKAPAPMWDHKKKAKKCGLCQKVFPSGNQYHKHRREAHMVVIRPTRKTIRGKPPTRAVHRIVPRAVERNAATPDVLRAGSYLGKHRVMKATSRAATRHYSRVKREV